jgi:cell wall-associated NlpC family hydrolase
MGSHRARHGASSGGRSVNDILAQVTAGPGVATANTAAPCSAFAMAVAATVGAGAAAASVTGTFPAIQFPGLSGTHAVAQIIEPVAAVEPAAHTPTSVPDSVPDSVPASTSALASAHSSSRGARGGTVMATDLHQTDATEIAALSRAVSPRRTSSSSSGVGHAVSEVIRTVTGGSTSGGGAVQSVTGAIGTIVDSALRLPSRIGGVPLAGVASSRSAAIAVRAAATKLGRPYVWGAKGPYAFDCSGLMQWAYKQAGIMIPPNSSAQSRFGTPVSLSDLRPGDMVFYYSPVSHVGMYLGNGKMLHASEPGKPVKVSPVNAFPIHNARRVSA